MEDFSTNTSDELNMSVSPILLDKDGQRYACVSFSDGKRTAEGRIPSCQIHKNEGFSDTEVKQLEDYMKDNVTQLKSMAVSVDVFKAFKK